MIPEMTDLDVFFHVHMVKVLPHPTHITPVEIPFTFPVSQSFRVYDIHVVHLLYSYYLHVLFNFVDFQLCGAKKYLNPINHGEQWRPNPT